MNENQDKIIEAGWQGNRSARDMVKKLISLGATPEEIKDAIEHLASEAKAEAVVGLAQK